ncbi:response regulator transcription factor [Pseudonocardia alni]|uniref:response regulator transcription factor n=1 Tax=Pseudonocardia alni TaxID=33907 RepID=UPI0033FCEAF3
MLVDDHPLVLEGLGRALSRRGVTVVRSFIDPDESLEFLRSSAPESREVDLLVLDLRLGTRSGVSVLSELLESRPDVQVAILTSFEDGAAAAAAIQGGARGFLLKDVASDLIAENLRSIAEGNLVIDKRLAAAVFEPREMPFSRTDLEIIRLVSEGHTNREIAVRLHLSAHTVKAYLSRCMRKLGTTTRAETVARATHEGWLERA